MSDFTIYSRRVDFRIFFTPYAILALIESCYQSGIIQVERVQGLLNALSGLGRESVLNLLL